MNRSNFPLLNDSEWIEMVQEELLCSSDEDQFQNKSFRKQIAKPSSVPVDSDLDQDEDEEAIENAGPEDSNVGREEDKEDLQPIVKKIRRTNNQILEDNERKRLEKDQKAIIKQKDKENKEVC